MTLSKTEQEVMHKLHTPDSYLQAMREYPNHLAMQRQICQAIVKKEDDDDEDDGFGFLQHLHQHDAPTLLLRAMKSHGYSKMFLSIACGALRTVISASDSHPKMDWIESGSLLFLLRSLRQHRRDASLQLETCKLFLQILSKNKNDSSKNNNNSFRFLLLWFRFYGGPCTLRRILNQDESQQNNRRDPEHEEACLFAERILDMV
eukprot:CAMPEP_0116848448 /NCGR_PEP_ID=MMETSP0418-20121206/15003_1 /TAXON_ID=1158023 /ORGANISM="Astrosyne radiata, Strain 13vi08-1A" /LENGTH=203 /DNA_ID=CAMNT_0004480021 /DNA_START=85 /DNA_END=693 /DNA_ORIENTATION=-